jgi:hypothetical protein
VGWCTYSEPLLSCSSVMFDSPELTSSQTAESSPALGLRCDFIIPLEERTAQVLRISAGTYGMIKDKIITKHRS